VPDVEADVVFELWSGLKMQFPKKKLILCSAVSSLSFLQARLAFGQEAAPQAAPNPAGRFAIDEAGISILTLPGWEIKPKTNGISLMMLEPEKDPIPMSEVQSGKITGAKPKDGEELVRYRRSFSVAVKHSPAAIDQEQMDSFKADLTKYFQGLGYAKDFQIIDGKFVDVKSKGDGILLFSQATMNGILMQQMHLLVSGSEKHVIVTYADLAASFAQGGESYNQAWQTMMSVEVPGNAPERLNVMKSYVIPGAIILVLLGLLSSALTFVRRRKFQSEADDLMAEEANSSWEAAEVSSKASDGTSAANTIVSGFAFKNEESLDEDSDNWDISESKSPNASEQPQSAVSGFW